MGKGYAEGPAAEERFAALERGEDQALAPVAAERAAVFGSTAAEPAQHFLGWLDDVDPEELFSSGAAWGLHVRRLPG